LKNQLLVGRVGRVSECGFTFHSGLILRFFSGDEYFLEDMNGILLQFFFLLHYQVAILGAEVAEAPFFGLLLLLSGRGALSPNIEQFLVCGVFLAFRQDELGIDHLLVLFQSLLWELVLQLANVTRAVVVLQGDLIVPIAARGDYAYVMVTPCLRALAGWPTCTESRVAFADERILGRRLMPSARETVSNLSLESLP